MTEQSRSSIERFIILFLYISGIISLLLEDIRSTALALTPTFLFLNAIYLLHREYKLQDEKKKYLLWAAICFSLGLLVEIIGTNSGLIFGEYSYGDVLGVEVFSTPIIIGVNWFLVISSVYFISRNSGSLLRSSVIAATFAVLLDILIEPTAIKLRFWQWANIEVPLQNYIAWFTVSFLLVYIGRRMDVTLKSSLNGYYYLMNLLFFGTLTLTFA